METGLGLRMLIAYETGPKVTFVALSFTDTSKFTVPAGLGVPVMLSVFPVLEVLALRLLAGKPVTVQV